MADCKNCLHYEVCADVMKKDLFIKEKMLKIANPICKCFLDKSRIIELPCKVGDYLYTNSAMQGWYMRKRNAPYRVKIVFIGLNDSEKMGGGFLHVLYENDWMLEFPFSDIGKTIFLTYEEAKRLLKERD